ncbi:MAG TPA: hypothetical protein VM533_12710 [Fimbriiglobus sp.]|jgi:hypothetical protein|nr:hypothetical protein [Fimbriiglobus sp.]
MLAGFAKLIAVALAAGTGGSCDGAQPVRVTVVAVFASTNSTHVDEKLKALAREVRKREPELTGFRVAAAMQKSVPVGKGHTFELPDKQSLKVKIDRPKGKDGRVGLTIRPPGLGEITYTCACDKFFPIVTPHTSSDGERLIIAVMAKPCTGK